MRKCVCVCVRERRAAFHRFLLCYTCLGQGRPQFFRASIQMCGGSRVAAMYSKSASEGSSICGVERCAVSSAPSHGYKRKFVLPSSHEALWVRGDSRVGGARLVGGLGVARGGILCLLLEARTSSGDTRGREKAPLPNATKKNSDVGENDVAFCRETFTCVFKPWECGSCGSPSGRFNTL